MTSAPPVPSTRDETESVAVSLKLRRNDSFQIEYPDRAAGEGTSENDGLTSPTRLLGAAIATCLAASLLHCLKKSRIAVTDLGATAIVTIARNDKGRLRVQRINVLLDPRFDADAAGRFERCGQLFEDYCTVTESVRQGIDVRVTLATPERLT